MFELFRKYGLLVIFALCGILLLVCLVTYNSSYSTNYDEFKAEKVSELKGWNRDGMRYEDKNIEALASQEADEYAVIQASASAASVAFTFTFIIIGLATLAVLIFPVVTNLHQPKAFIRAGIGLGVLLAIVGISRAIAGGGSAGNVWSETLVIMAMIVLGLAVIGLLALEIFAIVRK